MSKSVLLLLSLCASHALILSPKPSGCAVLLVLNASVLLLQFLSSMVQVMSNLASPACSSVRGLGLGYSTSSMVSGSKRNTALRLRGRWPDPPE